MQGTLDLRVIKGWDWDDFLERAPRGSIALDGAVKGVPGTRDFRCNFDHHAGVTREATMSSARQVMFAIKGGVIGDLRRFSTPTPVYVNDSDQDASLAVWLIDNYKHFEGTNGNPLIHRLLEVNDRLDVTGGGYPMNLRDELLERHNWVFEPYNRLRAAGGLGGGPEVIRDNIEAVCARLTEFMMGGGGRVALDMRHEVLYESPFGWKLVDEIGGLSSRYLLYSQGMRDHLSIVATLPGGGRTITVATRSPASPFQPMDLYPILNAAEGLTDGSGWNGSNLIGGSDREVGTRLSDDQLVCLIDAHMETRFEQLGLDAPHKPYKGLVAPQLLTLP